MPSTVFETQPSRSSFRHEPDVPDNNKLLPRTIMFSAAERDMASCNIHEALGLHSPPSDESAASSEGWCSGGGFTNDSTNASTLASTTTGNDQKHDGSAYYVPLDSSIPKEVLRVDFTTCSLAPTMAPFEYLSSLPSKGVREQAIAALNDWVDATPESLEIVTSIVSDVHNMSLMLDDVQDNSPLRRSAPSTHSVFGVPQTINSASYMIIDVIDRASRLGNPNFLAVVIDEMKNLVAGQSLDLFWTYAMSPPTVDEYLQMVDGKTGGLFRMISRSLVACKGAGQLIPDLSKLMTLLGRYFQIRDDYMNLVSHQYTNSKGTCEDLDEGKYSYVMIHGLQNSQPKTLNILKGLLQHRKMAGCAGPGHKKLFLQLFAESGSLEHTAKLLRTLRMTILAEVEVAEQATGRTNNGLRKLLEALKI